MPSHVLDAREYVQRSRAQIHDILAFYLPSENTEPRRLHQAMRYSVLEGGKRIRPLLALAAFEYCGGEFTGKDSGIARAMAAIEYVHNYSLIHDDLPCMDDDDLRRGQPTCHKKFDEATAVLAGDALHVVAFRLMAETGKPEAVLELAQAVGTTGMIGGQVADLEAEGKQIDEAEITRIHRLKTGALIRGAVRIGGILADADSAQLTKLTTYGEKLGLSFQIIDDILDISGDEQKIGKQVGSDKKNLKATYPGTVGFTAARETSSTLIEETLALFEPYEEHALVWLARYIGKRDE